VQGANAAPSRLHSKVEGVLALKANDAAVELFGLAGCVSIVVSGGGADSTVQVKLAGVASVFPVVSVARTSKVCEPSASPV
jgi:hypothetical protein